MLMVNQVPFETPLSELGIDLGLVYPSLLFSPYKALRESMKGMQTRSSGLQPSLSLLAINDLDVGAPGPGGLPMRRRGSFMWEI